ELAMRAASRLSLVQWRYRLDNPKEARSFTPTALGKCEAYNPVSMTNSINRVEIITRAIVRRLKGHAQAGLSLRGLLGALVVVLLQRSGVPKFVQRAAIVEPEHGAFPAVEDDARHGLSIGMVEDVPVTGHEIARTVEQRQKLHRRRVGAAV